MAGEKVLMVDDDALMRKIVQDRLVFQGYHVAIAKDGVEGFEKALSERPDILVTDWIMPQEDGVELCRKLRAHPDFARLPIIMLTSRSQIQDKMAGLDAGADDYLAKPFDPQELEARIRALLRRGTPSNP